MAWATDRLFRWIVVFVVGSVLLAACGGGGEGSDTLAPLPTNLSTTTASSLAPLVTTTGVPDSTTTSVVETTTTVPPAAKLVLRGDSLGDVRFGVDADGALAYVESLLGPPDQDSGYVDSVSEFGVCPGEQVRGVRWGDLLLLFGDESEVASGRMHFHGWRYGPIRASVPEPTGPATEGGITLGATVSEVLAAHPSAEVFTDDVFGAGFDIDSGARGLVSGSLSKDAPSGVTLTLFGGVTCGEWVSGI